MNCQIAIFDNCEEDRKNLAQKLTDMGYRVLSYKNYDLANGEKESLIEHSPKLAIIEAQFEDATDGLVTVAELKKNVPNIIILVYSNVLNAKADQRTKKRTREMFGTSLGSHRLFPKDRPDDLLQRISELVPLAQKGEQND